MKKYLSKKEKRKILECLGLDEEDIKSLSLPKSDILLKLENDSEIYFVDNKPLFFKKNDRILPTLILIKTLGYSPYPWVKVDEGAVKPILNGADVLRPGVTEISPEIKKNSIVIVLSPKEIPIAVGISLYDYGEMLNMEKGKVIKTVHYYGDKIFNAFP